MLTLRQRLSIAYSTEYFPERKRVVDLLKLLAENTTTVFKSKEILGDGVSYEGWIGPETSVCLKCTVSEMPCLYIKGELLDTSDCNDLTLYLANSIHLNKERYHDRNLDMDTIVQQSINTLLGSSND